MCISCLKKSIHCFSIPCREGHFRQLSEDSGKTKAIYLCVKEPYFVYANAYVNVNIDTDDVSCRSLVVTTYKQYKIVEYNKCSKILLFMIVYFMRTKKKTVIDYLS